METENEFESLAVAGFLLAANLLGLAVATGSVSGKDGLRIVDRARRLALRADFAEAAAHIDAAERFVTVAARARRLGSA